MTMRRSLRLRSITVMMLMAVLVWSVTLETCIARRGRHWRHNHRSPSSSAVSDFSSSKKSKSHGNSHHSSHNNHNNNNHHHKSKPKPKPKVKSPPKADDNNSPLVPRPPKVQPPSLPPPKGTHVFNVMDFGAKGDGKCDDTKVRKSKLN